MIFVWQQVCCQTK